jgi:hypothetical protein
MNFRAILTILALLGVILEKASAFTADEANAAFNA